MTQTHLSALAGKAVLLAVACSNSDGFAPVSGKSPGPPPAADTLQAAIDLGRELMFDERLSQPRGIARGTSSSGRRGASTAIRRRS